jgi:predicted heme/steroid binding protein/uncharacterized membrane protein
MEQKKFTRQELASFNGQDGKPAYVAYKGRVIDVTASTMWRGGTHMKLHQAGQDLSDAIAHAPHTTDVLDRYPQVGTLVEESPAAPAPARGVAPTRGPVERFLQRHPFFKRHPHPMTVHFPIVCMIFAPLFTLLYLITGVTGFEITAVDCLAAGLIACLVVIPTGFFTWWVNYEARQFTAVTVKIVVSLVMFLDGLAAFIWRLLDPSVVARAAGVNILYLLLVFLLLPMVIVTAWFGATLTFPLHKERRET